MDTATTTTQPPNIQTRQCRIHAGTPNHLHRAACETCLEWLTENMEAQAPCWHPDAKLGFIRWRCIEGTDVLAEYAADFRREVADTAAWLRSPR
jgi:hypothetical protein